ncbi:MAG: ABC transporter ATP-binding protein [Verrucomicrobiota bacterium]
MRTERAIQFEEVTKHFGQDRVLDGLSLTVAAGESVAIQGPSGCGKSTLLNLMGALDRADAGSVVVQGTDLQSLDDKERTVFRGQHLGFVFQLHHLLPQCSVLENALLPALAQGAASEEVLERAEGLLGRVGLSAERDRLAWKLSGGERQRVALVRALLHGPALVLADEPTGALDAQASKDVVDLLLELTSGPEQTLVLVTHDAEVAARLDRRVELRDGKVVS